MTRRTVALVDQPEVVSSLASNRSEDVRRGSGRPLPNLDQLGLAGIEDLERLAGGPIAIASSLRSVFVSPDISEAQAAVGCQH
jgi:hypothetical protein